MSTYLLLHPYERKMQQQNVVAAKPLDKKDWNFIGNIVGLNNEVFVSYDVFYNEFHYNKLWIFGKVIALPFPFWLWTSNATQRSFEICNNPLTGAASEYSLGKEKPKMLSSWPLWLCLIRLIDKAISFKLLVQLIWNLMGGQISCRFGHWPNFIQIGWKTAEIEGCFIWRSHVAKDVPRGV